MMRPLHVIVLDGAGDRIASLVGELQRRGYATVCRGVTNLEPLADALGERSWDLIVASEALDGNLAYRALELVRVRGFDLPFGVLG